MYINIGANNGGEKLQSLYGYACTRINFAVRISLKSCVIRFMSVYAKNEQTFPVAVVILVLVNDGMGLFPSCQRL